MNIKSDIEEGSLFKKILLFFTEYSFKKSKISIIVVLASVIIIGLLFYSFYLGAVAHRQQIIRGNFRTAVIDIISSNIKIPINYVKGLFVTPETISMDVKFEEMQQLSLLRDLALEGDLISEDIKNHEIQAALNFNEVPYTAKISLFGTWLDHLNSEKFSLQVRIKKKKNIKGMRKFSLMHPKVRQGIYEWLVHQLLRRENLIALRYSHVNVVINGVNKGIYALEEGYAKQLLENNE